MNILNRYEKQKSMIEIIKKKEYWVVVFVFSIFGLLYAVFHQSDSAKYESLPKRYICAYYLNQNTFSGLVEISDPSEILRYKRFVSGKTDTANFNGPVIKINSEVGLFKEDKELNFSQVIVKNNDRKYGSSVFRCWVPSRCLKDKPCDPL